MPVFEEEDIKLAEEIHEAYNDDNVHVVLVKGFYDDDKIVDVIAAATELNDDPKIMLRTGHLKNAQDLLQRAFSHYSKSIKVSFTSNKPFVVNRKNIHVDKWNQNNYYPIHGDISIYYPIQSVIAEGGENDLKKLRTAISNDNSKLIVLVTTNDVKESYLDFSLLADIVDKSFVLDSSKKYPDLYSTVLNNLKVDKIHYE